MRGRGGGGREGRAVRVVEGAQFPKRRKCNSRSLRDDNQKDKGNGNRRSFDCDAEERVSAQDDTIFFGGNRHLVSSVTRWMVPRMPEEMGWTLSRSCIWKRSPYFSMRGL